MEDLNGDVDDLQDAIDRIDGTRVMMEMMPSNYFGTRSVLTDVDWYLFSAIVQSSSNTHAAISALRSRNTINFDVSVRLQLDVAMRVHALSKLPNMEEAASSLMNGAKFSSIAKDLRDAKLLEALSERASWVQQVYRNANSSVHLTADAIKNRVKIIGHMIFYGVSGLDSAWPDVVFSERAKTFQSALSLSADLVGDFLAQRSN